MSDEVKPYKAIDAAMLAGAAQSGTAPAYCPKCFEGQTKFPVLDIICRDAWHAGGTAPEGDQ